MTFALLSRSRSKPPDSVKPVLQRKSAHGQRPADLQSGLARPVFQPLTRAALPTAPVIQLKLRIGEPNDKYEREADRVADRVMRMPAPDSELPLSNTARPAQGSSITGNGLEATSVMTPLLQRRQALTGQGLRGDVRQTAGEETQEESPCPSWFGDPESISKRAAETYVQNDMTPPSKAMVARIGCEPPVPNGNYACTVHFSDGLIIRVIVRKQDIVVGVPPLTTLTPPPATPLCFYDYACPEGELILTRRECKSAKGSARSSSTTIVRRAAAHGATGSSVRAMIQRKCAACTDREGFCPACIEEERIRRQPLASIITPMMQRQSKAPEEGEKKEQEMLLAKEAQGRVPQVTPALEGRLSEIKNGGRPLPESVRSFFEPRFGVDFSGVRVHADGRAAQLAGAVDAVAFTAGRDVVFGAGQYVPETAAGRRLLAHELTHVVQQRSAPFAMIQRQPVHNPCRQHCDPAARCATLEADFTRALEFVDAAIEALSAGRLTEFTQTALGWYFKRDTDTPDGTILGHFNEIRRRLTFSQANILYVCANRVTCEERRAAAFVQAPVHANSFIHFCDIHFTRGGDRRAYNVVHEGAHLAGLSTTRATDIYGKSNEFRTMTADRLLVTADTYALFARAIATGEIPSRLVHAIGGTLGPALGAEQAEFGWLGSLYWESTLQRPLARLIHPTLRLNVTMLGVPERKVEGEEARPTSAALVGLLGGIRIENPRPQGRERYFSLFGGPTLNFVPGSGGVDVKPGLEVGVGGGYRWQVWDVGVGATYRYNPAAPEGFEHTFQIGPTITWVLGGETR